MTPQTVNMGEGWTYTYASNRIRGFKQTYQLSPWINDYGKFAIMPITGEPAFDIVSRITMNEVSDNSVSFRKIPVCISALLFQLPP